MAFAATSSDVADFFAKQPERPVRGPKSAKSKTRLALPRHERGERFIQGPIPLDWMKAAAKCGQRAEAVALLLWYTAGWQKANPVKLTPAILAELLVHPKTARRVLERMADVGLVKVEFHRGRAPVVTIVPVPRVDPSESV